MPEAPITLNITTEHIVVGVGDIGISSSPNYILSTYALGSCLGIVIYAPIQIISGLAHFMLPDSSMSPERALSQPSIFVDTGMRALLKELNRLGVIRNSLRIFLAGGASDLSESELFNIGARNIEAVKNILARENLQVTEEELGGLNNRTIHFELSTGLLEVKTTIIRQICLK